ncbi:hypothetical protein [Halorientalis regularis]|jgi:hypothetical protein|uniref:Uncharacterized protein n=1 Tax=Halorientalis regularis TaxID=660518 RepID=A0A1G7HYL1_9EURY|nr:hypothetical protein [Halorientalis regularis]SDF05637.1 hypothetical protein SAMN05216218_103213 [Halorientalis regularis]
MAERSDQRTRPDESVEEPLDEASFGLDDEPPVETDTGPSTPDETGSSGLTGRLGAAVRAPFGAVASRLRSPFEGLFSLRAFLLLLVTSVAGMLLAGTVLPFGSIGGLVGIAAATFAAGLAGERSRYVEASASGALASGISWLLGNLVLTAVGPGVPLVAVGVGFGVLAALLGHYFGRDLRSGLTRDL